MAGAFVPARSRPSQGYTANTWKLCWGIPPAGTADTRGFEAPARPLSEPLGHRSGQHRFRDARRRSGLPIQ